MQSGSDHGSRSYTSWGLIEPTLCDSRSLLANIFGETTRRASRTYASRMPASPVLRILDPRLALAIFAANTKWRHIERAETAQRIKTRCSHRNSCPTEPHPAPTLQQKLSTRGPHVSRTGRPRPARRSAGQRRPPSHSNAVCSSAAHSGEQRRRRPRSREAATPRKCGSASTARAPAPQRSPSAIGPTRLDCQRSRAVI